MASKACPPFAHPLHVLQRTMHTCLGCLGTAVLPHPHTHPGHVTCRLSVRFPNPAARPSCVCASITCGGSSGGTSSGCSQHCASESHGLGVGVSLGQGWGLVVPRWGFILMCVGGTCCCCNTCNCSWVQAGSQEHTRPCNPRGHSPLAWYYTLL